jgi:hypothetical protein
MLKKIFKKILKKIVKKMILKTKKRTRDKMILNKKYFKFKKTIKILFKKKKKKLANLII